MTAEELAAKASIAAPGTARAGESFEISWDPLPSADGFEVIATEKTTGERIVVSVTAAVYKTTFTIAAPGDYSISIVAVFGEKRVPLKKTVQVVVSGPKSNTTADLTPDALAEDTPKTITLYTSSTGIVATACALTDLDHVQVQDACACVDGVCSVGVIGEADYAGSASFKFSVSGNGMTSNVATAKLTIAPVNDAPALTVNAGLSTYRDAVAQAITSAMLNATDIDNSPATVTFEIVSAPTRGNLLRGGTTLAEGGTFTAADVANGLVAYTHTAGDLLADNFTFRVRDAVGAEAPTATSANPATFAITVACATGAAPVLEWSRGNHAGATGHSSRPRFDLNITTGSPHLTFHFVDGPACAGTKLETQPWTGQSVIPFQVSTDQSYGQVRQYSVQAVNSCTGAVLQCVGPMSYTWAATVTSTLVADINTTPATGSNPVGLTVVGDSLVFLADSGLHGTRVWKLDAEGSLTEFNGGDLADLTTIATDYLAGGKLPVIGNEVFFIGTDPDHGNELWKVDVTTGVGSRLTNNDNTSRPAIAGGAVYFIAEDGSGARVDRYSGGSVESIAASDPIASFKVLGDKIALYDGWFSGFVLVDIATSDAVYFSTPVEFDEDRAFFVGSDILFHHNDANGKQRLQKYVPGEPPLVQVHPFELAYAFQVGDRLHCYFLDEQGAGKVFFYENGQITPTTFQEFEAPNYPQVGDLGVSAQSSGLWFMSATGGTGSSGMPAGLNQLRYPVLFDGAIYVSAEYSDGSSYGREIVRIDIK